MANPHHRKASHRRLVRRWIIEAMYYYPYMELTEALSMLKHKRRLCDRHRFRMRFSSPLKGITRTFKTGLSIDTSFIGV